MFFARNIARCGSTSRTTYLDQLEFAETVGYDGLGVNEHHANAYELNPSPCLMAAALARHNSRAAPVVLGSWIALHDLPIRVAEEFAMLDVMSGGRLVAGFSVGTSMDTNYAYGRVPGTLRECYAEATRGRPKRRGGGGAVCLQWTLTAQVLFDRYKARFNAKPNIGPVHG
jgi:alkanesulfonate monooxygenase SsuD/methylene tetrahydromethanopterin reductase-like flavin-dependent oxidoreductase (luciferase family)